MGSFTDSLTRDFTNLLPVRVLDGMILLTVRLRSAHYKITTIICLSAAVVCSRMDMVISAGKSRENVDAFVLLPPDAKLAIDSLIDTRAQVGVPAANRYTFGRMNSNTPMAGHTELQELAFMCQGLK